MNEKKTTDNKIIPGSLALAFALLIGAAWWVTNSNSRSLEFSRSISTPPIEDVNSSSTSSTTTENATENADAQTNLKLQGLGDTDRGYSILGSANFRDALVKRGIGFNYAQESDQEALAAALAQEKADLIGTSLEQFLTHKPNGKIVALLNQTEKTDGTQPNLDVVVASERILKSNPKEIQDFVETYYDQVEKGNLRDGETAGKGMQFFTAAEAKDWMKSGTLAKKIGETAEVLAASGKAKNVPINTTELFTANYLPPTAEQSIATTPPTDQNPPEVVAQAQVADSTEADQAQGSQPEKTVAQPEQKPDSTATQVAEADDKAKESQPEQKSEPNRTKVAEAEGQNPQPLTNLEVLGEVKFARASFQLSPQQQQKLTDLAEAIQKFSPSSVVVKVQGHTSRTGNPESNQILSQARAQEVVNYLKSKYPSHQFVVEGLGFSEPQPGTDPTSPVNQRTVISLLHGN
ncbi:MAG: OmpA family protein [Moorea sp. SIOASIH]|uniref:OmpA family protein n=1 Tax=Moorena sp. SIOASIH TaxID=2607817 RepID=UPI0013BD3579|nr:OmpA family protein [Moorena sp. SIOASIH]NEO35013.1 OmpA family protein [Moorena sp. SIOASIH]